MVTVNELLGRLVSVPLNVPKPVSAIIPTFGTTTLIVTINVCPTATLPTPQLIVPPAEPAAGAVQIPIFEVTELNTSVDGRVVLKTTSFAIWFWPFLICQV